MGSKWRDLNLPVIKNFIPKTDVTHILLYPMSSSKPARAGRVEYRQLNYLMQNAGGNMC